MAHTVKITSAGKSYEIGCQSWDGPNADLSQPWTTLTLTGITRCSALPSTFAQPITIDYNGFPINVAQLEAPIRGSNTVRLRWM